MVLRVGVFIVQLLSWAQSRLVKHLLNLFLSLIPWLKRCDVFTHSVIYTKELDLYSSWGHALGF